LTSFGDMLRVPGTRESLQETRSRGGRVQVVYSPVDAVNLAVKNPQMQVVFFAVGFETTAPATALAVLQAWERKLDNFSLLTAHVRVQPAMEAILRSERNRVQAFLAAGHVCTVTGFDCYRELARRHGVPIAVTGFEPSDLLAGILCCVEQLEAGRSDVINCYPRAVTSSGNTTAQAMVDRVYEISDQHWRGLGIVNHGGLRLRSDFAQFDARKRFRNVEPAGGNLRTVIHSENSAAENADDVRCRAAEVLSGVLRPVDCPEFGKGCTPDSPLGAPMVSGEGACAAYFQYGMSCPVLK
ncbi:MAG: hydrogenase formation protein HypD, partial [Planctomycetaceae bacterium]|nr:hydrogenase formation protein HypD [Planctomycetaceae bacterium]